ncbi:DUF7668 domain-containing protein [Micromonospora sp. CPCC 206061]|uniref:DUF7668 domain-containing protein n=1 Tax=Micromonospora sp. CPCC 206061 TaxID=3122410 RepID=UPI002FF2CB34
MVPYEVPIGERYRAAIEALVRQLADGKFEELVRSGQVASHAVKPIAALIRRGGQNLVPLPSAWWEDDRAVMFPVHEPDEWCAVLPLQTQDGGHGAIWLEAELYLEGSEVRAEVEQVFLPPSTTT